MHFKRIDPYTLRTLKFLCMECLESTEELGQIPDAGDHELSMGAAIDG
jgi:hypothetical protein